MSTGFDETYAAEQIRRRLSPLRRLVKAQYLARLASELDGPTIDLGCGAGQLLERLPHGSIGLEFNDALIRYLEEIRLPVLKYDALADDFALTPLRTRSPGSYEHLVCSHVLEHFDDAAEVLRKLTASAAALGLRGMTFVVPGLKGFRRDPTHRTFITEAFIRSQGLDQLAPFRLTRVAYFPGNWRRLGEIFDYHECILTWRH